MTDSQTFEIFRDREPDVRFTGTQLGRASSRKERNQARWLEVEIYQTEAGSYVVAIIGRSVVEGEEDRFDAHVLESAHEVVEVLYRSEKRCPNCGWTSKKSWCVRCELSTVETGKRYLTVPAREALEQAASLDPAIDEALIVEVA